MRSYQKIKRRQSRVINVGSVKIGGNNPIAVQTMTNTLTSNVKDTISQIERSAKLGADIIRVSVPDKDSSTALKEIVKQLYNLNLIDNQWQDDTSGLDAMVQILQNLAGVARSSHGANGWPRQGVC